MYWHLLNLENYSYKPTWIKTWTKLYPDYSTAHKNIWVQIFKLPFKTVRETLSYKRIFGVKTRKHLEIIWRGINAILDQSIAGEGGMSPNYAPCGVLKSYCKGVTMSYFLGQIIWRGVNTISHQSINAEWWYGTLMWWPRSLLKKSDLDLFLAGSKINFTALLSLAWDKHRSRPVSWLWDKHRSTPVSWLWDRCETNFSVHGPRWTNAFIILILCWFIVHIYFTTCQYQWFLSITKLLVGHCVCNNMATTKFYLWATLPWVWLTLENRWRLQAIYWSMETANPLISPATKEITSQKIASIIFSMCDQGLSWGNIMMPLEVWSRSHKLFTGPWKQKISFLLIHKCRSICFYTGM